MPAGRFPEAAGSRGDEPLPAETALAPSAAVTRQASSRRARRYPTYSFGDNCQVLSLLARLGFDPAAIFVLALSSARPDADENGANQRKENFPRPPFRAMPLTVDRTGGPARPRAAARASAKPAKPAHVVMCAAARRKSKTQRTTQTTNPTTAMNITTAMNRVVLIRTATQSMCRRLRDTRSLRLEPFYRVWRAGASRLIVSPPRRRTQANDTESLACKFENFGPGGIQRKQIRFSKWVRSSVATTRDRCRFPSARYRDAF
jgi:hypothetical protein